MKPTTYVIVVSLLLIVACTSDEPAPSADTDFCQYVDPFIGTADNGHTFPGATVPFGMIQASPETGNDSWKYCSGYNDADASIIGFAQTHLNGTGCSDLGDILLLPFSGDPQGNYRSAFKKSDEKAAPGYYAVRLGDFDIDAELTATPRTAFHRYTFHKNEPACLLLDMQSGSVWDSEALETHVLAAEMEMPDNHTITGHQQVHNWVTRHYYYEICFDKPYTVKEELPAKPGNKAKRLILSFDLHPGETLQVKVAMSSVSVNGAQAAMKAESPDWDFDAVCENARREWNDLFARAKATGSVEQKKSFYTSLYHLFIQPNNIADIDGQYRGVDDSVRRAPSGNYYSTLSLWDTYRAAHPLYTILLPEKVDGFIESMLEHYKTQQFLPIWALWGKETFCMIGNHAIPVIVDAYLKGFTGFDHRLAYEAIKTSSTVSHFNSDWETYMKYGYYPFDIIQTESVSKTLESVFDDWCVAQMAKALGKTEDYDYFIRRADFYRNLFDPQLKLMRGKDSKGQWRTPFDSFQLSHAATSGGDFTEGNSWQYTWHIQHDIDGLIGLMGDNETFTAKLDSLFFLESTAENSGFVSDVTGLIGQYAHGNEPSHHVLYLYSFAGKPWKTQELVREVFDRFYLSKPDGLCGNDDCGQMSAWYIFSAMGFYPVNPASGEYVLGAPQIEKIELALPNGKTFTVEAKNLSEANKYVQSVELNGQPYAEMSIRHADIMNGGQLTFTMTDRKVELTYLDAKGRQRPVTSLSDWEKKRTQLLDSLQAAMGPLPSLEQLPAFDVHYRDSVKTENYTRYTIDFTVAENEILPAFLYMPNDRKPKQKRPAMLALHQTVNEGKRNTDEGKNMTYAKELAHRGYVVIAPDYPSFGDLVPYDFENDRYQSGTMKGIFDHIRCVDLLQSMPEVDPERIGVIGHSLGGHNAMFVGAFDTRLKVIVVSCAWTEFEYYNIGANEVYGGRLGPWAQNRYMPLLRDKYQLDGDKIPFNFNEVIALFAPRWFLSNSPERDSNFDVEGVRVGIDRAIKAYRFLQADDRIQVRYPEAEHDFPPPVRLDSYRFVDKVFDYQPVDADWLVE